MMEAAEIVPGDVKIVGAAVRFIRARGGRVFVWGRPAGADTGLTECSTTTPDDEAIRFEMRLVGGIEVNLATQFFQPPRFVITLERFPRPHLIALWDGGRGTGDGFGNAVSFISPS
jgi:hypothetical protein